MPLGQVSAPGLVAGTCVAGSSLNFSLKVGRMQMAWPAAMSIAGLRKSCLRGQRSEAQARLGWNFLVASRCEPGEKGWAGVWQDTGQAVSLWAPLTPEKILGTAPLCPASPKAFLYFHQENFTSRYCLDGQILGVWFHCGSIFRVQGGSAEPLRLGSRS